MARSHRYGATIHLSLQAAAIYAIGLSILTPAAEAKPLILNCEILEGASEGHRSTQIMIDEENRIAVYNYQLVGPNWRKPVGAEGNYIDLSMKITSNNSKFIQANDNSGALLMTKSDAKFVKAWVIPVPLNNGDVFAFSQTHEGKCTQNPFQ
jgi:hypothetical protein